MAKNKNADEQLDRAKLIARGYRFNALNVEGSYGSMLHIPCGLMVGLYDTHDKYCPAYQTINEDPV